jgi:peptide methionine sulfoxide reductase MsrB
MSRYNRVGGSWGTRRLEMGVLGQQAPGIYVDVVSGEVLFSEVRSKEGDFHLAHVFPDGSAPIGLR